MEVIKYFVLCEKANALSKVKQNVGMVIKRGKRNYDYFTNFEMDY